MAKVLDISRWTAVPTPDQVACLWELGYRRVVIGTRADKDFAAQFAAFAEHGGWTIEAYLYLYWAQDGAQQARDCVAVIDGAAISRVWLDVEFDDQNLFVSTERCYAVLDAASVELRGYSTDLYSSASQWAQSGMDERYADRLLWDANYGPLPRPWVPYGGWTEREMVQAEGSVPVCGLNVDNGEEEPMTTETKAAFAAVLKALADLGAKVDSADPPGLKQDIQSTFALALRNQERIEALEAAGK